MTVSYEDSWTKETSKAEGTFSGRSIVADYTKLELEEHLESAKEQLSMAEARWRDREQRLGRIHKKIQLAEAELELEEMEQETLPQRVARLKMRVMGLESRHKQAEEAELKVTRKMLLGLVVKGIERGQVLRAVELAQKIDSTPQSQYAELWQNFAELRS